MNAIKIYTTEFVEEIIKHNESQGRTIAKLKKELEKAYDKGFAAGLEEGRTEGYDIGYEHAFESGCERDMAADAVIDTQNDMIDELKAENEDKDEKIRILKEENFWLYDKINDLASEIIRLNLKERGVI